MSFKKFYILPFVMLFYKEVCRFSKVLVQTVFTPVVTSFLYLLIFGISLGKELKMSEVPYLVFLIPGLVMMSCLNNAFQNSSSSVISSKFSGDMQDYKVTPLSYHHIIWAMALGSVVRGLIVSFMTYLIGQCFYFFQYGEFLSLYSLPWFIVFLFLGGVSFGMLGIAISIIVKTFDQMSAVGTFVITPLIYLGGVFFSIEKLAVFWKILSQINPLFYFINGFRYGFLGSTDVPVEQSLLVSLLTFVIFYLLSYFCLKKGSYTRW